MIGCILGRSVAWVGRTLDGVLLSAGTGLVSCLCQGRCLPSPRAARRAPRGRHKCLDGAEPRLGAGGLSPNRAPVRRAPSQLPVRSRPRTSTRLGLEAYAAKVVWSSQQAHRIATARRIRTASIPAPRTSSSNHFEAQKARFQPQKPWCSCRGRDHFEFCS